MVFFLECACLLTCGSNVWYSYALQIPATTEDSDFEGPETELLVLCNEHGKAAERRVAFEGIHTGRRFLCCAEKVYCDLFSLDLYCGGRHCSLLLSLVVLLS